jgi:hypothetical protein
MDPINPIKIACDCRATNEDMQLMKIKPFYLMYWGFRFPEEHIRTKENNVSHQQNPFITLKKLISI